MSSWKDNYCLDMPNDVVRNPDGSPLIVSKETIKKFENIKITMKENKTQPCLFIWQEEEQNEIFILTKREVEDVIKQAEENVEAEFTGTTIGSIRSDITLDQIEKEIVWYKDEDRDEKYINNIVLKICNKLKK